MRFRHYSYLVVFLCGCPLIGDNLASRKTADTSDTSPPLPDTGDPKENNCDDGVDNDGDTLTDCEDMDCRSSLSVNVRPTDDVTISSDWAENMNEDLLWIMSTGDNRQESWLKFDATESIPSTGRLEEVQICVDDVDFYGVIGGESIELTTYQLTGEDCSSWTQTEVIWGHPCERGDELATFTWHETFTSARCFTLAGVDFEHVRDEGIVIGEKTPSVSGVMFVDQENSVDYPYLAVNYSECTAQP